MYRGYEKQRQFPLYLVLPFLSLSLLFCAIYVSVKSFISQPNNDQNEMCQPSLHKSKYSTKNDAVFFMANENITPGLKVSIKSLKSTGCQAKIVLIADINFNPNVDDGLFLKQNNVEIFRTNFFDPNKEFIPQMIRYKFEREWLENHSLTNNILHSNAYNVFFQKDPFSASSFTNDKITFVVEPRPIRSCEVNQNLFEKCYGERAILNFKNDFIINSGAIIGSANEYSKLLKVMMDTEEWSKCYWHGMDQTILNYLVWSGKLKEKGINYRLTGCDGGFMTVQWCVINNILNINDRGNILSPSGHVPSVLNQYNSVEKLEKYLFKSCSIKRPKRK